MSKSSSTPVEPLKMVKGDGPIQHNGVGVQQPSDGEKSLSALDNMMTESMRLAGLLPLRGPDDPAVASLPSSPPPNIADYDPMRMPVWTLLMALAWIATRDAERVTWQRDEWRRANGLPEGSIPTVSIGAMEGLGDGGDEDEDDPTVFRALDAFDKLKAAGEGDEIEVHAMALGRNEPVTLRPLDWTYGKLSFDSRYDEVWRVGGEYYHTMTVGRENLLRAFPPDDPGQYTMQPSMAGRPAELDALIGRAGSKSRAILVAAWKLWGGHPPPYDGVGRRDDDLFATMQEMNPSFKARPDRETFRLAVEKYVLAISSEIPPG